MANYANMFLIISIHTLRMEGDYLSLLLKAESFLFQSTPSAWRVTLILQLLHQTLVYFNPHPPHGG